MGTGPELAAKLATHLKNQTITAGIVDLRLTALHLTPHKPTQLSLFDTPTPPVNQALDSLIERRVVDRVLMPVIDPEAPDVPDRRIAYVERTA